MESLNIISSVAEILLYLALVTALIFIVAYFRRITLSAGNIENQIERIAVDAAPLFKEIKDLTADIKDITYRSRTQFYKVEHLVDKIAGQGEKVLNTLRSVENITGKILKNGNNFLTSLGSGFRAFIKKYN